MVADNLLHPGIIITSLLFVKLKRIRCNFNDMYLRDYIYKRLHFKFIETEYFS